ncbi:MAG: hypothetical protein HJHJAOHD_02180 [Flavobacteriales bacterium]|nr:hypothetical protein [Flavobacteriales bacterium]
MKFNQSIVLLIIALFFISCANQVKEDDRLEQVYPYSSATYIGYKKDDNSGETGAFGELKFTKSSVILRVNNGIETTTDNCNIRTVTYDDNPNEIKYRTNYGDFVVKVENDTIKEVTLYTADFLTIFNKAKTKQLIEKPIPAPLSDPEKGWKRIEIADIGSIDLAPELEIQGGDYKVFNAKLRDKMGQYLKVDFSQPKLTLQPKGINEFNQQSLKKYIRIMVETIPGNKGEFDKINEQIEISDNELSELNSEFKSQIIQSFQGTTLKLIEWYPTEIVELNNMTAIRMSYKRQLKDQPHVMVEIFRIQNNDRMHSLTISYRENEKSLWKTIIEKTKASYRITNIK